MADNRQYIEEITSQFENRKQILDMFSDHFDCLSESVIVSLGVHFERNTIEDVVVKLRQEGINALPYYDSKVKDNLNCFVVDGTGISSPVLCPEDAIKATADIIDVMARNNIRTSLAIPISQESLPPSRAYKNNIMDMQINNPTENGVDEFISQKLREVDKEVRDVVFDRTGTLWRGGTLGDKPYAISHHDRKRDVAYGTKDVATAIGYADGYDGRGMTFKAVDEKSYGFLYQFREASEQRYYSMAFIENGREVEECKNRPENRADYETPVLPARNSLKGIYVVLREKPKERPQAKESTIDLTQYKILKIADENGYLSEEWKKFANLHTPYNTSERNDYMVERMNKQIADFVPVLYVKSKQNEADVKIEAPSIRGLVFSNDIKELNENSEYQYELKNANFKSFKFPKDCSQVQFTGNFIADNCTVSEEGECLNLSKCTGIVGISNCDLSKIKEIVLPEKCYCFFLENVKLSKEQLFDFTQMQCDGQRMVFRDCDFSDYTNLNIPLNAQFNGVTKLPYKFNISEQQSSFENTVENLRTRLKLVDLEQQKQRNDDSFSPQYIAHGTHVSPDEFAEISGQKDCLPAFTKATQNELETIKDFLLERPEFMRQIKEQGIRIDDKLGIPKRVFGIPTKADNTGEAVCDKNGIPEPQAGSFAYALKKCSASISTVDDGVPLLIGFEEKYKQFEDGNLKGHIYILEGKGFGANYNKEGIATEYTLSKDANIVHHLEITPEKAMQGGAQFVMFKTEEEYGQWARDNKFQDSFKSDSAYMQSLVKQIEMGNAVYINATSRGVLPRLSVLDKAQNKDKANITVQNKTREMCV